MHAMRNRCIQLKLTRYVCKRREVFHGDRKAGRQSIVIQTKDDDNGEVESRGHHDD